MSHGSIKDINLQMSSYEHCPLKVSNKSVNQVGESPEENSESIQSSRKHVHKVHAFKYVRSEKSKHWTCSSVGVSVRHKLSFPCFSLWW